MKKLLLFGRKVNSLLKKLLITLKKKIDGLGAMIMDDPRSLKCFQRIIYISWPAMLLTYAISFWYKKMLIFKALSDLFELFMMIGALLSLYYIIRSQRNIIKHQQKIINDFGEEWTKTVTQNRKLTEENLAMKMYIERINKQRASDNLRKRLN
jgi:hypothetical protein